MSYKNNFAFSLIAGLAVMLAVVFASPALADGATDNPAAEYRHKVMETLGGNAAALVDVLSGKVDAPGHLKVHAATLAQTATLIGALFPEGSEAGHALPLIWEEPDQVAAAAQETVDATAALAAAVESGDRAATMQAFRGVGDSCKGCHERYKEEDD